MFRKDDRAKACSQTNWKTSQSAIEWHCDIMNQKPEIESLKQVGMEDSPETGLEPTS